MKTIRIYTEYIELQQLLKMTAIIHSGGEAKIYLSLNQVKVNGIIENRRGRKLYPGDKIDIHNEVYIIEKDVDKKA